ncbi:methyl-accepting chemotaxis protein [Tepidiphilus thermophilus]|uniref:Methyl-accepting chemotaxis protein n=1 Tax=Tepidiphilus thermophilus TaxID=876478 RepID=A0A0K6IWK5_9PROT|nr:methyl-accepting chemotaxis protein [Tepidiphilus thermophilus]CUB07702.1 Methyl-accepting chemotaxis protein [Tepidiphilus thermophilus]
MSLSVKSKLITSFCAVAAMIAVVITVTSYNLSLMAEAVEEVDRSHGVITALTRMREALINMETGVRGFALSGKESFLEPVQIGEQEFQKAFQEALANTQTPQRRAAIERLAAMGKEWQQQGLTPLIALRQEINAGRASFAEMEALVRSERGKAKMDEIRVTFAQIIEERHGLLQQRLERLDEVSTQTHWVLYGSGAVAFALAITLALALARSIGGRIAIALQAAEATAAGDLTTPVRVEGSDEIGRMLQAVATMQQSLREMLGEIRRNTDHLSEAATTLATVAGDVERAVNEQNDASSTMAAAVEELTVSIGEVAKNAEEASSVARESGAIAKEGGEVMQRTVESIKKIADRVTETAKDIGQLEKHSAEITSIVNVIETIAEQTNLLALNAAIEAARAGEYGRGFAVVADEVRKLAERTTVSTQEITEMIAHIQQGTKQAVTAMETSVAEVEQGVQLANAAGESIERIAEGSGRVIDYASHISDALKEQSVASNQVARNVETIVQMADKNHQAVSRASATAKLIEEAMQTLRQAVGRFKIG